MPHWRPAGRAVILAAAAVISSAPAHADTINVEGRIAKAEFFATDSAAAFEAAGLSA